MVYAMEAWTIPGDEEGTEEEIAEAQEFRTEEGAQEWAWERIEEGYAVRLYRR